MARDERRFKMADLDNDMKANKEEFTAFLHPEEYDHMKDIVVLVCGITWWKTLFPKYIFLSLLWLLLFLLQETMEDIDKNGDGLIDLDEYIGEIL